jgi:hypothetical protein
MWRILYMGAPHTAVCMCGPHTALCMRADVMEVCACVLKQLYVCVLIDRCAYMCVKQLGRALWLYVKHLSEEGTLLYGYYP